MHRLEMPDCIAESEDLELSYVSRICDHLIKQLESTSSLTISPTLRTTILVLENAANCSTFCATVNNACDDGEISIQQRTAYWRAADSLGDKLGVNVPTS